MALENQRARMCQSAALHDRPAVALALGVVAALAMGGTAAGVVLLLSLACARRQASFVAALAGWFAVPTLAAIITASREDFALGSRLFYGLAAVAAFAVSMAPTILTQLFGRWSGAGRAVALMAPLLPVLGDSIPFAPILQLAALWPGLGLGAISLALVAVASATHVRRTSAVGRAAFGALVGAAFSAIVCQVASSVEAPRAMPAASVAVSAGPIVERSKPDNQYALIADLEDALQDNRLVVSAEAGLGVVQPGIAIRLDRLARGMREKQVALIGAVSIDDGSGSAFNGAVVVSGDTHTVTFIPARVSMPVPASGVPLATGLVGVPPQSTPKPKYGNVALMFCLEEILGASVWEIQGRGAIVVLANHWWDNWGAITRLQMRYGSLWSRVFGLAMVRADSTPTPPSRRLAGGAHSYGSAP